MATGDSGGPLLLPDAPDRNVSAGEPRFDTLIALTSFGDPTCVSLDEPGGYTLVGPYLEWIFRITKVGTSG